MHLSTIFLCLLWQTLQGISVCDVSDKRSDFYEGYNSDGVRVENVLKADVPPEDYVHVDTALQCVTACSDRTGSSNDCSYVIYFPSSQKCKLVGQAVSNFTEDQRTKALRHPGFKVAKRVSLDSTPLVCQNNGQPATQHTCECVMGYAGRYCEVHSPSFCTDGSTQIVTFLDFNTLVESKIPVTAIVNGQFILSLNTFDYQQLTAVYFFQAQNFLDLTSTGTVGPGSATSVFTKPFKWTFMLQNLGIPDTDVAHVTMNGSATFTSVLSANVIMYRPKTLDPRRKIYGPGAPSGTIDDVIASLSAGHRKLGRELSQVEFDVDTEYVSYQTTVSRLATVENMMSFPNPLDWRKPLVYETFKDTLGVPGIDVTYFPVLSPQNPPPVQDTRQLTWETDRCWTKVNPTLDYDEFTSVLKEFAGRGFDLRIVVDEQLSSDVTEIQQTGSDVVVQLPWSLMEEGIAKGSVVSRSKTFAHCERDFQGAVVHGISVDNFTSSEIQWFVSMRRWSLTYSVNKTGHVIFGNTWELYTDLISQGKLPRVCVHYSHGGVESVCHGSVSVSALYTPDLQVLLQTHASFRLDYYGENDGDKTGFFRGIVGSDCPQYVKVISTMGWIEEATIVMESTNSDVNFVDFDRIDIFIDS